MADHKHLVDKYGHHDEQIAMLKEQMKKMDQKESEKREKTELERKNIIDGG
jgi:hypothetical protein